MNIYKTPLFKFLAGDALVGKQVVMTMDTAVLEMVESAGGKKEEKVVLYFKETKKGMILNKTNAKRIGRLYGGDVENWNGQVIELYTEEVKAFGETHNAIRVSKEKPRVVKVAEQVKAESAKMTPAQHKERLSASPLQPSADNDAGIGDDEPGLDQRLFEDGWADFVHRALSIIPWYQNEGQVSAMLQLAGLEYQPDQEAALFDALAGYAKTEADKEIAAAEGRLL